jgi:hypothetical protein
MRGKTPGTQMQRDATSTDRVTEIRHRCADEKRNDAQNNITCPGFGPSYLDID